MCVYVCVCVCVLLLYLTLREGNQQHASLTCEKKRVKEKKKLAFLNILLLFLLALLTVLLFTLS